ncbi:hypothetical protein GDO86_002034 [Hymenochirus boettgeri]|uniref:Leucine-rich repeat-containing protein 43 n=1 Tax=Hymenochirus boettgeri TaxID=247094 RepID=A0A8T2KKV7_9PIPI|nr:hypothetical protein GDO86_002034 [Hymenochirus boettgeri]
MDTALSDALEQQLRSLCLNSFPCGVTTTKRKSNLELGKAVSSDTYCESDDPEKDSVDTLQDLLTYSKSPWALGHNWNCESQNLRQLAVKCPESITQQFIYSYFTSLRVVDKEVTTVDEELLKFQNLEELVLSANKISTILSSNLPRTVKVLELGSNQISNLRDLSVNPPPKLQHLGLSYNRIDHSTDTKYLTADFWPNLVSLDLSFNDLTELFDLVNRLSSLEHLRVLVLQGNPLSFITPYRGFTLDSLPLLFALDDIPILPDERHQFSGISKNKKVLQNTAQLQVNIGKLKGIPNPTKLSEPQESTEYPVIKYDYYVTYEFVKDQTSREKNNVQTDISIMNKPVSMESKRNPKGAQSFFLPVIPFQTGSYRTNGVPWLDVIDFNYKQKHVVGELLALKSFLLSGMMVTVTEEKTLLWPLDQETTAAKSEKKVGRKEKDKGRSSSKGSKGGSKTKKKNENLDELRRDPAIVKVLGSAHVNLESLVYGEMQVSTVWNFGTCCAEQEAQSSVCDKTEGKKNKERKISGRTSADIQTKSSNSAGKSRHKNPSEIKPTEDQLLSEPVPLTMEIQIQIIQLSSSLKAKKEYENSE